MLPKAPPTTSNLNLVSFDFSNPAAVQDMHDGIPMADLVESLDTRELDIGDGEDIDYDGNTLGVVCQVLRDQFTVTSFRSCEHFPPKKCLTCCCKPRKQAVQ